MAIIVFVNAVKGISASQMSRALGVQYKTSFVLLHKLRAAIVNALEQEENKLSGVVKMDGCYVGKTRPKNKKEDRLDLRLAANQNPNKRCVLVARQRADDECIGAIATKTFICLAIKSQVVTILMRQNILQ